MKTLIFFVVPIYILFPIVTSIISYKHWAKAEKFLFLYLLIAAIFNAIAVITSIYSINNLLFMNIYILLEFFIIGKFLNTIVDNFNLRKIINILIYILSSCHIILLSILNIWSQHNNISRFVECILLMLLLIYLLFQKFSKVKIDLSLVITLFSFLLYFSCASCLFLVSNIVNVDKYYLMLLWGSHGVLLLLLYSMIAVRFIKLRTLNESYN